MHAVLTARTDLTDSISSFAFQLDKPFRFTAGQYINLTLTGHTEHGQPAERWFTISSSPTEETITITTRVGSAAHSAYKRALNNLKLGDSVDISEPMGAFVLPKLLQTKLVFIAGGIGITPFASIASWLAETGEQRDIRLIYSVSTEDDIIFTDVFEKAKQHATIVVSEPSSAWGGERGQLTGEMILGLAPNDSDTYYYVSGPEGFVQSIETQLTAHGVSGQQIVIDEFQGYNQI